jgi:hypothetical protein
MIQLTDKLIGQTFTAMDPNIEYKCVGWAQNTALLIIGANWDQANNRFQLKSVKLEDCKFKGQIPV